jgi:hypothetical protein
MRLLPLEQWHRYERSFSDAWNPNLQLLACATSKVAFMR